MVEQRPESLNLIYILLLTMIASIAGVMFGLDLGIIGGSQDFIYHTYHITLLQDFERASTVASVPLGALIGAVVSAKLSLIYGRRDSLFITGAVYSLGILLIVFSGSIWLVVIGRLLMGFAVGLSCMVAPMYLGEVSPYEVRGAIVFIFQLAITVGILLAYFINYLFISTGNWRAMFASCLVPSVFLMASVFFLPRSPRWLIQKARKKEAEAVLQILRKRDDLQHELQEIEASVNHPKVPLRKIFNKRYFPLVLLAFSLFVFQQLSGANTIFYYVTTVFHQAGGSIENDLKISILAASVNTLATVVGVFFIDRVGRRRLVLVGMSVVVISLLIVSAAFHHLFGTASGTINIVAILVFIAFYAVSLGGVPYIIMAEIFPLNVRHLGMSIASFANWLFNTLVAFTFLYFIDSIGLSYTYLFYAICTFIGLVLMYYFLPETKNISLEQIEKHFFEKKKLRHLGQNTD